MRFEIFIYFLLSTATVSLLFIIWGSWINPVLPVLFLIVFITSICILLIAINLSFLGIVFFLIYLGAIAVLFLIVVMTFQDNLDSHLNFKLKDSFVNKQINETFFSIIKENNQGLIKKVKKIFNFFFTAKFATSNTFIRSFSLFIFFDLIIMYIYYNAISLFDYEILENVININKNTEYFWDRLIYDYELYKLDDLTLKEQLPNILLSNPHLIPDTEFYPLPVLLGIYIYSNSLILYIGFFIFLAMIAVILISFNKDIIFLKKNQNIFIQIQRSEKIKKNKKDILNHPFILHRKKIK